MKDTKQFMAYWGLWDCSYSSWKYFDLAWRLYILCSDEGN